VPVSIGTLSARATSTHSKTTLRQGRFGIMSAFDARLDDFQIKLLVALPAR
jgi:hypothetical protein